LFWWIFCVPFLLNWCVCPVRSTSIICWSHFLYLLVPCILFSFRLMISSFVFISSLLSYHVKKQPRIKNLLCKICK
jgi:hypothetical protein